MSDSLTATPEPTFVCHCKERMRNSCEGEPFYKELEGKRYCVLHFPGKDKSADFEKAFQNKLEDKYFNFRGVWFPDLVSFREFDFGGEVDFSETTFNAEADFGGATFSALANFDGASFNAEVYFVSATFLAKADFSYSTFSADAHFSYAVFSAKADFSDTTFRGESDFSNVTFKANASFATTAFATAIFNECTFSANANFISSTFFANAFFIMAKFCADVEFGSELNDPLTFRAEAIFAYATFKGLVRFAGSRADGIFADTSSLNLEFARIEKPDHLSFHTVSLRPHWFLNVDATEFDFTNVDWGRCSISEEIKCLKDNEAHSLLAIACRHLAVNAENNHRYEEASKFRYMAMDVRRRERWRGFGFWKLSWWYWLASGYGERASQAGLVLLGIMLLSAVLYNHVGFARWEPKLASESDVASAKRDDVGVPLKFSRALTYSAAVMTFQKPEPRPATTAAQTVVLLETILGPVQAALLALAIRRKFMR